MKRILFAIVKPISKLVGKITAPWITKEVNSKDYNAIISLMQDGDVLLSYTKGHLTNWFIQGEFKHASIVCDDGVIEAIGEGVVKTKMFDFARTKDRIALLRPKFATPLASKRASEVAKTLKGYSYDYLFEANNKEFYCSELVIYCYDISIGSLNLFKRIYDDRTVLPYDFYQATDKFELIYDSKGGNNV